jgi:hypothetical protein
MIKEAEITEQAVRAEVARILSGRTLRGKETLQRLLSYLAERTLDGSAEAMKEYTIGVEVFGKPEDYNPQEDASVRVQLGRLRQKLEEHYRAESHAAPVVIELPKRQFALQFHSQAVAAPTSDLTAAMESLVAADELPRPAPGRLRKVSWPSLLLGALTVAALWAGWSFWQTRAPGQTSANAAATAETLELNELWRPFLASNRPVTMAVTMRPFLRYERGVIWDWEVSELPRPERDARMAELRQRLNAQTLVPWEQTYTSFGEATGIFLLTRLFEGHHHDLQLKRSGTLAWEEIAERNIIFLGAGKSGVPFQKIPIERAFVELGDRIVKRRAARIHHAAPRAARLLAARRLRADQPRAGAARERGDSRFRRGFQPGVVGGGAIHDRTPLRARVGRETQGRQRRAAAPLSSGHPRPLPIARAGRDFVRHPPRTVTPPPVTPWHTGEALQTLMRESRHVIAIARIESQPRFSEGQSHRF